MDLLPTQIRQRIYKLALNDEIRRATEHRMRYRDVMNQMRILTRDIRRFEDNAMRGSFHRGRVWETELDGHSFWGYPRFHATEHPYRHMDEADASIICENALHYRRLYAIGRVFDERLFDDYGFNLHNTVY